MDVATSEGPSQDGGDHDGSGGGSGSGSSHEQHQTRLVSLIGSQSGGQTAASVQRIGSGHVQDFMRRHHIAHPEAIYLLAWTILLQRYLDQEDVCFAVSSTSGDVDVDVSSQYVVLWQHLPHGQHSVLEALREAGDRYGEVSSQPRLRYSPVDATLQTDSVIRFCTDKIDSSPEAIDLAFVDPSIPPYTNGLSGKTNSKRNYGFDIELLVNSSGPGAAALEVRQRWSDLVDPVQACHVASTFQTILDSLCLEPNALVGTIDIVSHRDKALLAAWKSGPESSVDCCLHDILARQALLTPSADAIAAWDGTMTYQELHEASTQLGHYLAQEVGIQLEQLVGFAFEKSLAAVITVLAIFKAGGVYTPLDPDHPTGKLSEVIDDLCLSIVVCSPSTRGKLAHRPSLTLAVVDTDLLSMCKRFSCNTTVANVTPSNAAALVFTSGTTGKPKGVVVTHNAFSTNCTHASLAMRMTGHSRVFQFASYTYDLAIVDLVCVLCRGACLCVPSDSDRLNNIPAAFAALRINHATLTPSVADQLDPSEVSSLTTLVLGGEALASSLIQRWAAHVELINIYGVTETCGWTTATQPLVAPAIPRKVGRPICGNVWIANSRNFHQLAPIGGIGEIIIESPSLARHYLGNPEATARAFPTLPHFLNPNTTMQAYRSGDLGYFNLDGDLLFVGRRDAQVKISGQRIELSGLEDRMKDFLPAGTATAAVVVYPTQRNPVLIGYIVLDSQQTWPDQQVDAIKSHLHQMLKEHLPSYTVPSVLLPIPKLPRTRTGKVDRMSLAKDALNYLTTIISQKPSSSVSDRLWTPTESILKTLWSKALDADPALLTRSTNFLHFGDSVAAMSLVKVARKAGYGLDFAGIMHHPILQDMASHCDRELTRTIPDVPPAEAPFSLFEDNGSRADMLSAAARTCHISEDAITDLLPCTPLQEGLIALSLRHPGTYILQEIRTLKRETDVAKFRHAWESVNRAHDILRTRIFEYENSLVQVVCRQPIHWDEPHTLEEYVSDHGETAIPLGAPLTRFALFKHNCQWIFVLTRHHATYDGHSQRLIDDIHYKAYCGHVPASPVGFSLFLRHLRTLDYGLSAAYWQEQLKGVKPSQFPIMLHNQRQYKAEAVLKSTMQFSKPQTLLITPSILVRSAWALLVAKHCLSDEAVIGNILSGRSAPVDGIDDISGPTIASVPVRVQIDKNQTVEHFLARMHDQATQMIPHENFGLQKIRRLGADAASACAFQTLLAIHHVSDPIEPSPLYTDEYRADDDDGVSTEYAVTLHVWLKRFGANVAVVYDGQVLSAWYISSLVKQLEHTISQLCSRPNARLSDLDYFGPADRARLDTWTDRPLKLVHKCAHHVFEQNVAKSPEKPAVVAWDGTFSYLELDKFSNQLAHYLITFHVGPESVIAICYERSKWVQVCLLAAIKAGGAFVLLNPDHPPAYLKALVADVKPALILTSPLLESLFWSISDNGNKHVVGNDLFARSHLSQEHVVSSVQPQNSLYYIFTSGTTGKPKGSIIPHRSFLSTVFARMEIGLFSPATRVLQFTAHSFDVSVGELLGVLLSGGSTCIPSDFERNNDLPGAMRRLNVNTAFFTPSFARSLDPDDFPTLNTLQLAGEAMTQADLDQWRHIDIWDTWGPSECTDASASQRIRASHPDLIGPEWSMRQAGLRAYASNFLYLVEPDNHDLLTPLGGLGEIVICGPNVGYGYFKDPSLTALAFVDKPDWLSDSLCPVATKVYKTGDIGRYGESGTVIYVGRKDSSQVKLRGQRLELGAVETHLQRLLPPTSYPVVEVIVPTGEHEASLVAFLYLPNGTPSPNPLPKLATLESTTLFSPDIAMTSSWHTLTECAENDMTGLLSHFMVPTIWIPLAYVPLTPSQKLDRNLIKATASGLTLTQLADFHRVRSVTRAPETSTQLILHRLWADVLNLELNSIGLDQSWFRIGGNSIDAMKLAAKARKNGLSLTVRDIFKHPRLQDMAAVAENDGVKSTRDSSIAEALPSIPAPFSLVITANLDITKTDIAELCALKANEIEDIYPCTPLQEGLVAISAKSPGREMAQFVFRLAENTQAARLKAAWSTLAREAQILRTRIVEIAQGTAQVVLFDDFEWNEGSSLNEYLCHDLVRHMGLTTRLFRLAYISNDTSDDRYLCLTLHHAIYDGWSFGLMLKNIEMLYGGSQIVDIGPPFNAFIAHLQKKTHFEDSRRFWSDYLVDYCTDTFPRLPSTSYAPKANASLHQVVALDDTSRSLNFALSTVIRAAWGLVIAAHTGNADVAFGSTVHGRSSAFPNLHRVLGPTFTAIPVRINVNRRLTVCQFLQLVQEDSANSTDHEHFGLPNISNTSSSAKLACKFQNVLVIQPEEGRFDANGALGTLQDSDDLSNLNNYGIMLDIRLDTGGFSILASFDSKLIESVQMERIIHQFAHVTAQLCLPSNSDCEVWSLDLLSPQDRQSIASWNSTWPQTLHDCVHDVIAVKVSQRPHAEAVCAWDGSLTYRELDSISSHLAKQIELHGGAKPNKVIPLCFDKSVWVVVAILAVMKSGSAFVLLDAAHHPVARMRQMIEIVKADLLLCGPAHAKSFQNVIKTVLPVSESDRASWPGAYLDRLDSSSPNHLLCVLFTSGSTGVPKAIAHNHAGLRTSFDTYGPALGIDSTTRILQFSAFSFDVCVGDILAPLMHGGCVCIPSDDQRMNDITRAANTLDANWAFFTPSFARSLDPAQLPGLRTVVLGGETISTHDEVQWADRELLTGYGPAETSLCMAAAIGDKSGRRAPNLGFPVGCRTWITDVQDHNKLVPIGVAGELVIEGPVNAAGGYLHDPERTSASFIQDPEWLSECVSPVPQRFFKTGDLVRYAADGSPIFIGRLDTQIKLRGQRIEVDEVELHLDAAIKKHNISESSLVKVAVAVATRPGREEQSLLAAFVCHPPYCRQNLNTGRLLSSLLSYLKQYIGDRLPSYMVPDLLIPVAELPFTTTGKLNRKALHKIAYDMPEDEFALCTETTTAKVAPETDLERLLCGMFAEILHREPSHVYADDTLVRLGGDSITAMKLVARARALGFSLSIADVFNHGSPRELAARMSERPASEMQDPLPFDHIAESERDGLLLAVERQYGIQKSTIRDMYKCTALQAGLMSLSDVREGAYVAANTFCLPDEMNLEHLSQSWMRLVFLNSILRARIVEIDGAFYQVIVNDDARVSILQGCLGTVEAPPMALGTPLNNACILVDDTARSKYFIWHSHHSTYDGWTMRLLLDQLDAIHNGRNPTPLPSFSRFIKHLNQDVSSSHAFWLSQSQDSGARVFPKLPHPSYQPRGTAMLGSRVQLGNESLPSVTLSTLARAALAIVLDHWCPGDGTSVFGSIVSGRAQPISGIDQIAGPTLATVPIVVPIHKSELVVDFLRRVQEHSTAMLPHEHYGLQSIAKISRAAKEMSLFQTLLAVQPQELHRATRSEMMNLLPDTENDGHFFVHGLSIQCLLDDQGFDMKVNYDPLIITRTDVQRLVETFGFVVQNLALVDNGRTVGQIPLLSPQHLQLISSWHTVTLDDSNVRITTPEQILRMAVRSPQRPAISSWDGSMTYAELVASSSFLACLLEQQAIERSSIVPVCIEKSLWAVVSQFAIMQVGAAFVSLDPSYPSERIDQILIQTGSTPVIVSSSTAHLFEKSGRLLISVSSVMTAFESKKFAAEPHPVPVVDPRDLMYVIFTSGTTGVPKGIMIEHGAFEASSSAYTKALNLDENSRVFQFASYVFDASILEVFSTLSRGGCVCVPSEADRLSDLSGVIARLDVNWALFTPSVLRLIDPLIVPSLRTIVVGAEALTSDIVETWASRVNLYEAYGPAEASIICTTALLQRADDNPRTIGKPTNCQVWIVEPDNRECLAPLGCVGELLIQGSILARGYLNDETKTRSAFVNSPLWAASMQVSPSTRLYRTGDLVKYGGDGSLEFVERADGQVKIHGQRIETKEIEDRIRGLLQHQDVVVTPSTSSSFGGLVAVLCPLRSPASKSPLPLSMDRNFMEQLGEVNSKLHTMLPSYMIPTYYLPLAGLPLNTSGKVDRPHIQSIVSNLSVEQLRSYSPAVQDSALPSTEREMHLAAAWESVLGLQKGSAHLGDDFFNHGDSISAIRLSTAVRDRGFLLTASDIFRVRKFADLAILISPLPTQDHASLEDWKTASYTQFAISYFESGSTDVGLEQIESVAPCLPTQGYLMTESLHSPGVNVMQATYRLDSSIDQALFKTAWERLVASTEILRTRLVPGHGKELCQVVLKSDFNWTEPCDLEGYITQDRQSPFELGSNLSRFALIRNPEAIYFVWTIHHALYDGWSLSLLSKRLEEVYMALANQGQTALSLASFGGLVEFYAGLNLQHDQEYWFGRFAGYSNTDSRLCLERSAEHPAAKISLDYPEVLKVLPSVQHQMTDMITAAWSVALGESIAATDVIFGTLLTGRTVPVANIEYIIGPALVKVPVRVFWTEDLRITELLDSIHGEAVQTVTHAHLGLLDIAELSDSCKHACAFSTMLVIHPDETIGGADTILGMRPLQVYGFHPHTLVVEAKTSGNNVQISASWDERAWSQDEVEKLTLRMGTILTALSAGCGDEMLISELS